MLQRKKRGVEMHKKTTEQLYPCRDCKIENTTVLLFIAAILLLQSASVTATIIPDLTAHWSAEGTANDILVARWPTRMPLSSACRPEFGALPIPFIACPAMEEPCRTWENRAHRQF